MLKRIIPLVLVVALLTVLSEPLAIAEGIEVLADVVQPNFAQNISFHLDAQSDSEIVEVTLFYRETLELATNRAYPDFTPGKTISADYTWDLLPGQVPVGAELEYYWIIKDASGKELKTQPQKFYYNDTRFNWQEEVQDKVHLFWYGKNRDQALQLLKAAGQALRRIADQIGVEPNMEVKIYVYASKADMAPALVSRSTSYDELTTTLGILVSKDTLLLLGSASGKTQTLAHELTHLVVGQVTENPYHASLPRWLDEGLAMYNEGRLPDYNQEALNEAIDTNSLISVRSLSAYTGDPNLVNLFYAESYSVVNYLIKTYGKDKMVELLRVFSKGAYQDDALQQVYGFGLEELDAKWRAWVGAKPREPVATPTPWGESASLPPSSPR